MRRSKAELEVEKILFPYDGNYSISNFSYLGLRPGDLIIFDYDRDSRTYSPRLGLVVASRRGPNGSFMSTRNNNLINVFLLNSLSEALFELIVNNLYGKATKCTYKGAPKILGAFMGRNNFRTFNSAIIGSLKKVTINVNKFIKGRNY